MNPALRSTMLMIGLRNGETWDSLHAQTVTLLAQLGGARIEEFEKFVTVSPVAIAPPTIRPSITSAA